MRMVAWCLLVLHAQARQARCQGSATHGTATQHNVEAVLQVYRPLAAMVRPSARRSAGGSAKQMLLDASPWMRADLIARPSWLPNGP